MYGVSRVNIQRPAHEHDSITVLGGMGFGAVAKPDGSYLIAGTVLFWPELNFWQREDSTYGYGVNHLIATLLPVGA